MQDEKTSDAGPAEEAPADEMESIQMTRLKDIAPEANKHLGNFAL